MTLSHFSAGERAMKSFHSPWMRSLSIFSLFSCFFLTSFQSISEIISFQILRSPGTFFFIHSILVLSILFDLLALLDAFYLQGFHEGLETGAELAGCLGVVRPVYG